MNKTRFQASIQNQLFLMLLLRFPKLKIYSLLFIIDSTTQAFARIKEEKPEVYKKLVPIQGDVTFDGM